MARGLKFRILEEEELYYPCSENKGAFFAYAKSWFSNDVALLYLVSIIKSMRFSLFDFSDTIDLEKMYIITNKQTKTLIDSSMQVYAILKLFSLIMRSGKPIIFNS